MADQITDDMSPTDKRDAVISFFALPETANDDDVLAFLQSILVEAQGADDAGGAGDTAASIAARTHRVEVGGCTYDVTLTRQQVRSKAARRVGAANYARSAARLFGPMHNAEKYGVTLVKGAR